MTGIYIGLLWAVFGGTSYMIYGHHHKASRRRWMQ